MVHRSWYRFLAVLLFASLCGVAWGQAVRWEVSVGFGNTYKESAWTPVFVDTTNEGSSRTGELVIPVSYGRTYGPTASRRVVDYAIPVDLPRNSKKRYTLYVPPEGLEEIRLKLSGARTETRKLPPAREAGRSDTFVVVIGGDRGLLNFLTGAPAVIGPDQASSLAAEYQGGPPRQGEAEIQVGHAGWAGLPESWLGWDGVDAVVLGDAGFAGASAEAVEALLRWVQLGGTLVVPGGALSPEMTSGPLAGLLPVRLTGTTTLPGLSALGEWVEKPIDLRPVLVGKAELLPQAVVLCGARDRPLIAARSVGSGQVVFTTFDFGAAPVKYWDGQTAMWPRLLAQAPARSSLVAGAELREPWAGLSPAAAATYVPGARLPPVWLILGFLGAYIVVLVPVNYYLLKRLDRRELAWLTTPVIVVVFTVGAYAVGYGIRGGELVLNRVGVVEAAGGSGLARGRGYVGLFSPSRTAYELLLEGSAAGARDLAQGEQRTRGTPTVYYGPTPKISNLAMNMWTTRAVCVEFLADLKGGITGALEYDGADLRAKVKNDTGLRLKQCRIIKQHEQGQKEDLAPGQEAEIPFGHGSPVPDRSSWYGSTSRYAHMAAKDVMEELTLGAVFGEERPGYAGGPGTAVEPLPCLVAICEDPLVPVKLAGRRPKVNDSNLIIVQLPVRLAAGARVNVEPWLIARNLIACDGRVSADDPYDPGFTVAEGTAVFEFRVPLSEGGGKATALTLAAPVEAHPAPAAGGPAGGRRGRRSRTGMRGPRGGPTPGVAGTPPAGATPAGGVEISAYDFARKMWEALPLAAQPISFPNPSDHMSPDGRVLVRVRVPSGDAAFGELSLSAGVSTF